MKHPLQLNTSIVLERGADADKPLIHVFYRMESVLHVIML